MGTAYRPLPILHLRKSGTEWFFGWSPGSHAPHGNEITQIGLKPDLLFTSI
ncbi:MAG: hypothetical protein FD168_2078 [Desulfobulbaceae bacterium]|nr:MAG: hypothetical protein FD168_2078 [Desulfobulbaceae bacterium]